MKKLKLSYICINCGFVTYKWIGKCTSCFEWNCIEESEKDKVKVRMKSDPLESENKPIRVYDIKKGNSVKYISGLREYDRVIGGGIFPGSINLIGGEPGVGKSTLIIDICRGLLNNLETKVLYVSGEESVEQIGSRCNRMNIVSENLFLLNETCWEEVRSNIDLLAPSFIVLDSIQTLYSREISSHMGSPSQIKEVASELVEYAKSKRLTCFVVGHITKEGTLAGPRFLEHMVDTVVSFEGDKSTQNRSLRVIKNRFGSTNETGLFEMTFNGLKEIGNNSHHFLKKSRKGNYGRTITCVVEGRRPIFVEVQALVVENKYAQGKRVAEGIDSNRLLLLIAIISKYLNIPVDSYDIYINIAGGYRLSGRESDLALVAALLSSITKKVISSDIIFIGEVGLNGDIRDTKNFNDVLREAVQYQYDKIFISREATVGASSKINIQKLEDINCLKSELFM